MSRLDAPRVDLSGPLFQPDAHRRLGENIRRALEGMAEEGARVVIEKSGSEHMAKGVMGRVNNLRGKPWMLTAVVSMLDPYPWSREPGRFRSRGFSGSAAAVYRGGKLEGRLHMFRQTAAQMRRASRAVRDNLTRGME